MATAKTVCIIGGGLAGTVTAISLIRASTTPLSIVIIGDNPVLGRGIAYSTKNLNHLVNGLAKTFGLLPDQPDHLSEWLAKHAAALGWQPPEGVSFGESSPPRWLYGSYVQQTLADTLRDAGTRITFSHLPSRAVSVRPIRDGFHIHTADGATVSARYVVLATGLFKKGASRFTNGLLDDARVIDDPWASGAFDKVKDDAHLFIVGTGLTALDIVISAEDAGFRGTYTAISRRGLLVQERADVTPWPDVLLENALPRRLEELTESARLGRRAIRAGGGHRQQITGAIRPFVSTLWERATLRDKLQFIRHLRPFWENVLHRAALVSAARFDRIVADGRFVQLKGKVIDVSKTENGTLHVHWAARGTAAPGVVAVDRLFSGDGFEFDWRKIDDPLVRTLLDSGLVRPDATAFGIAALPSNGNVLDQSGTPVDGLYAVGHPLRGVLWESSAIGEQVTGAVRTARALAEQLSSARVPEVSEHV